MTQHDKHFYTNMQNCYVKIRAGDKAAYFFVCTAVLGYEVKMPAICNLVPRVYSAFKMAAEGGEDPGTHRYNTHADWSKDIAVLTLFVIGQNCLPCKMADLCSYICCFLCN